jgi:hypothetical protein
MHMAGSPVAANLSLVRPLYAYRLIGCLAYRKLREIQFAQINHSGFFLSSGISWAMTRPRIV